MHNEAKRHWRGEHGAVPVVTMGQIDAVLQRFEAVRGRYLDAHGWVTPHSLENLLAAFYLLGFIHMEVERIYETEFDEMEFFVVLKKTRATKAKGEAR